MAGLASLATSLEKTADQNHQYLLAEWKIKFEQLKLKFSQSEYYHGPYARDVFIETARLAAQLYKFHCKVELDCYATIDIESASNEIDIELSSIKVGYLA